MEILIRAAMVLTWIIVIPLLVLALIGIVAVFAENNEEATVSISILWSLCVLFVIPTISWIATGSPVTIYAALVYFMQGGLLS